MAALRSGHVALQLTLKLTRVASLSRDITGIDFAVQRGASAGLTVKYGPVDQPLWDQRREGWCGHEQTVSRAWRAQKST